jgi:HD-like signal output (HDOD) protein
MSAPSFAPRAGDRPVIDRARILKVAGSIGVLGSGAHSAPRIMAALCDPDIDARQVATLIGREPALYARVLRVANSAFYGRSRSVTTIERALLLLGLDAVRGIAAAACLDRTVLRGGEHAALDLRAVVRHSQATAAAAESLARLQHRALASEAFIAGLLHNLGIAVQMHLDPAGIRAMVERRRHGDTRDMSVLEAEQACVGHEECVAVIFEEWRLPEPLIMSTRHHHDPLAAPEPYRELAALISLGGTLALANGSAYALDPAPVAPNPAALASLGLSDEMLADVAATLPERIAQLKQALQDP